MRDSQKIPFLDLEPQNGPLADEIADAVRRVIEHQQFILGPEVQTFEASFASYCETAFALGCGSGSDAVLLALMAIGVGPGDQVICPAYTFFATASAVTRLGATPVFVDIDRDSYNLDPAEVQKTAAQCSRLKALLPVDLFGQTANTEALLALARELEVPVVEDAAQSIGARDARGRRAGSSAAIGCFSLYPTKNLGALGDAGAIVTSDPDLFERVSSLRNHGATERYFHGEIGVNSRLDTVQAAVLNVKLPNVDAWNAARRANASRYDARFRDAGDLPLATPALSPEANEHVYHQYVVRVPAALRDALRAHLADEGIATQIYYPLGLHLQEAFANLGYAPGDLPETEAAAEENIALPIYPGLAETQIDQITETTIKYLRRTT